MLRQLLRTILIAAIPFPLAAQSSTQYARIVDSLATILRARYVDADTGALIADRLIAAQKAGAFDTATSLRGLTGALTQTLRSVNGDKHLSVRPPQANGAPSNFVLGGASAISGTTILTGNIGYVAYKQIPAPTPDVLDSLASSMKTLAPADALIIDVRDDGGGAGTFNDYVWGYLAPGNDPVPTVRNQLRGGPVAQRYTQRVSGPRPRTDIPVYVLVNGRTGSAAEAIAFYLQQSGRARVVGERTAGAGHNVAGVPLPDSLVAMVSIGRVWYPATMKEWERVGVVPDDSVASANALCAAHAAALQAIAKRQKKPADGALRLSGC